MCGCEQMRSAFSSFSICTSWCADDATEREDGPAVAEEAAAAAAAAEAAAAAVPDAPAAGAGAAAAAAAAAATFDTCLSNTLMATFCRYSSAPSFTFAKMPAPMVLPTWYGPTISIVLICDG